MLVEAVSMTDVLFTRDDRSSFQRYVAASYLKTMYPMRRGALINCTRSFRYRYARYVNSISRTGYFSLV